MGRHIPSKKKFTDTQSASKFFKKKFHFRKRLHWRLPSIDSIFKKSRKSQTVPELLSIKSLLNCIKDQLNDYPLEKWRKFTAKRDPSGAIALYLRSEVKAEFVTKGWCKFYECLSAYPLTKVSAHEEFNSVHLCEAPGAFIAALNHYLKLNFPKSKFNWCATSLNPYFLGDSFNSDVIDDRLMVRTFRHWEFGEDFTGDITRRRNVDQLVARCRKIGKISLVTADGSVDCTESPNDQENKTHYLHFAEVAAALRILEMDGMFVLKMFTFFESATVSLLYFLINVFDKVDIFKPAASKQGNSEVYVICDGYQRTPKNMNYVLEMANRTAYIVAPMFALEMIPNDFIEQVKDCAKMFMLFQTEAIQSNIFDFQNTECDQQHIFDLQNKIMKKYCRVYRIKSIPDRMKLVYGKPCSDMANICRKVKSENNVRYLGLESLIGSILIITYTFDGPNNPRICNSDQQPRIDTIQFFVSTFHLFMDFEYATRFYVPPRNYFKSPLTTPIHFKQHPEYLPKRKYQLTLSMSESQSE